MKLTNRNVVTIRLMCALTCIRLTLNVASFVCIIIRVRVSPTQKALASRVPIVRSSALEAQAQSTSFGSFPSTVFEQICCNERKPFPYKVGTEQGLVVSQFDSNI